MTLTSVTRAGLHTEALDHVFTIGAQLDYIYHNGLDKWKTDIVDPVKAKYPKP